MKQGVFRIIGTLCLVAALCAPAMAVDGIQQWEDLYPGRTETELRAELYASGKRRLPETKEDVIKELFAFRVWTALGGTIQEGQAYFKYPVCQNRSAGLMQLQNLNITYATDAANQDLTRLDAPALKMVLNSTYASLAGYEVAQGMDMSVAFVNWAGRVANYVATSARMPAHYNACDAAIHLQKSVINEGRDDKLRELVEAYLQTRDLVREAGW